MATNWKQTGIKTGIIGVATVGAYIIGGGLESTVEDQTLKGFFDFSQSIATTLTPIIMANNYMNKPEDSFWVRNGIKAFSAFFGIPEVIHDFGNVLLGDFQNFWYNFCDNIYVKNYTRLISPTVPYFGKIKEKLHDC